MAAAFASVGSGYGQSRKRFEAGALLRWYL
jgi:hypothetical protein